MNGIYIHIPYCVRKCGYCDFYSVCDTSSADEYIAAVCCRLNELDTQSDTLYIGGGTPSLLGGERLKQIIKSASRVLVPDAEITVEVNPGDDMSSLIPSLAASGVNRLSIGMQSHNEAELKLLTRRHSASDVDNAVETAKSCGITNISLDVMLGVEGQTMDSLDHTLQYCADSGATHVSAYMLKIEDGTPFSQAPFHPDDDLQTEMYLHTVSRLKELGFEQYEISNFCRNGKRSRHNMKYWTLEPYIGIGAAAHSFVNGRRSYYPRSIASFIKGTPPIYEGEGGDFDECVMLGLRRTDGINICELKHRYPENGYRINAITGKAKALCDSGYAVYDNGTFSLTPQGFLVSNRIINMILNE